MMFRQFETSLIVMGAVCTSSSLLMTFKNFTNAGLEFAEGQGEVFRSKTDSSCVMRFFNEVCVVFVWRCLLRVCGSVFVCVFVFVQR